MWLTVTNILMFLVLEDLGGYTRVQKYASEGRCTPKQLNGTVFFFLFFLFAKKPVANTSALVQVTQLNNIQPHSTCVFPALTCTNVCSEKEPAT